MSVLQHGFTPLHLAVDNSTTSVMYYSSDMLPCLVTPALMLACLVLQHGFTPLHLAVDNNHTQLAKLLLDKGATTDAADTVSAAATHTAHQLGNLPLQLPPAACVPVLFQHFFNRV